MERKLIRNKLDFIQLYKSYKEEEYKNIQEDNITYPSEYPCIVLIDKDNWYYIYESDFNEEESDDTIKLDEDFFDCNIDDYKSIVGKCFRHKDIVLKVLGIRDDFDNKYYKVDQLEKEFLYEQYEFYNNKWHIPDYIWLQDMVYDKNATKEDKEEYLRFCFTPNTEMNIGREGMYLLGKDGLLYTDDYCSGEYTQYEEIPNETFEQIRQEAIDNDGEYTI